MGTKLKASVLYQVLKTSTVSVPVVQVPLQVPVLGMQVQVQVLSYLFSALAMVLRHKVTHVVYRRCHKHRKSQNV